MKPEVKQAIQQATDPKAAKLLDQEMERLEALLPQAKVNSPQWSLVVQSLTVACQEGTKLIAVAAKAMGYPPNPWEWEDSQPIEAVAELHPGIEGDGLASKDAGANNDGPVKTTSVVRAPNGNLDLRNSSPVVLTKSQRMGMNARVDEIIAKPVEDVTDEDRETLRQYTGIGGLGSSEKGAIDQFYTPYETIRTIFKALKSAGVKLDNVLEPSAGSGSFLGNLPEANWTTVDIDAKNYEVLRRLYPNATHYNASYEDVSVSGFDAVVSNVPFMENRYIKKRHGEIKTLHDFFFVQALEQAREDGVVAFIAPTGVMDKVDPSVRQQIVDMGDIIGAYRLPSGHFSKNAHTDVTSDLIFIQKRPAGVPARPANEEANKSFVTTVQDESTGARMNGWYSQNPESILGETSITTDRFGKKVYATKGVADLSNVNVGYDPYGAKPTPKKKPGKKRKRLSLNVLKLR